MSGDLRNSCTRHRPTPVSSLGRLRFGIAPKVVPDDTSQAENLERPRGHEEEVTSGKLSRLTKFLLASPAN